MKFTITMLFLIAAILFTVNVFGEEVPPALKDGIIKVHLKDGSVSEFSENDWKVVPRVDKRKVQPIVKTENKNRMSVLGGYGSTASLNHSIDSTGKASVNTNEGLVGGLQYQRKVSERISLGIQGQSNKTVSLVLGLDF